MRPMTPSSLYIPPAGFHPTRPWWGDPRYYEPLHETDGWTRRDGWYIYGNGYHWYASAPISIEIEGDTPEGPSAEELMEVIDAKWPLPSPPLRAGQVWLLEAQQSHTTALLNTTLEGLLRTARGLPCPAAVPGGDDCYGVEAYNPSHARAARIRFDLSMEHNLGGFSEYANGYTLGDQFITGRQAQELLLGNDYLIKAYLIADPVDPSIVPWTGARGKAGW